MWGMACWRPIAAGRPSQTHQCCFSMGSADPLAARSTFVAEPARTEGHGVVGQAGGAPQVITSTQVHLQAESAIVIVSPHTLHKHAGDAPVFATQLALVTWRTRNGAACVPALVAVPHCSHCWPHHREVFRLSKGP